MKGVELSQLHPFFDVVLWFDFTNVKQFSQNIHNLKNQPLTPIFPLSVHYLPINYQYAYIL